MTATFTYTLLLAAIYFGKVVIDRTDSGDRKA